MKNALSMTWKRSVQPRKQRKFTYNAALHTKNKLNLTSPLSKELRTKHNKRNMTLKKGDTIKISRGQFKGRSGKIESIKIESGKVYIEGIENVKKDGTKSLYPLKASNIMITELNLDDKMRKKALDRKTAKKEIKNG